MLRRPFLGIGTCGFHSDNFNTALSGRSVLASRWPCVATTEQRTTRTKNSARFMTRGLPLLARCLLRMSFTVAVLADVRLLLVHYFGCSCSIWLRTRTHDDAQAWQLPGGAVAARRRVAAAARCCC